MVRQDGPQSLAELGGKTLAFPSPRAFGATLLTRADLKRLNIPHDVSYLGTHESVYQAVAQGRHVAGGGVLRSFELLAAAQRRGLRILHTTAPVTAHVIAVHPRVPAPEAERVRQTLLKLHEQPVGAAQLGKLDMRKTRRRGSRRLRVRARPDLARAPARARVPHHPAPRCRGDAIPPAAGRLHAATAGARRADPVYGNMDDFEKAIYGPNAAALINANPAQAVRLVRAGYDIVAHELPAQSPGGMHGHPRAPGQPLPDARRPPRPGASPSAAARQRLLLIYIVPRDALSGPGWGSDYTDVSRRGPVTNVLQLLSDDEADAAAIGTLALYQRRCARNTASRSGCACWRRAPGKA